MADTVTKKTEEEVPVLAPAAGEIYILKGIKNFKCGKWHFEDEMMILTDPKEIKEFEIFLHSDALADQYVRRIRKVQAGSESLQAMKSKFIAAAVSGVETTANRPAQNLRQV